MLALQGVVMSLCLLLPPMLAKVVINVFSPVMSDCVCMQSHGQNHSTTFNLAINVELGRGLNGIGGQACRSKAKAKS